jgi:hypothetical protein
MCSLTFLTSCALYDTVSGKNKDEYIRKANELRDEAYKHVPRERKYSNIEFSKEYFVPKMIEHSNLPDWYYHPVSYNHDIISLTEMMSIIQAEVGIVARFIDSLDASKVFPLYFKGRMGEVIERISLATGYGYELEGNLVTWSRFLTPYIPVGKTPTIKNLRIGDDEQGGQQSSDSSSSSSTSTAFGNLEVKELMPWLDLVSSLKLIKSKEGSVSYDRSTSMVLVRDYPENVRTVERYLAGYNETSMTNVAFDFKILEYRSEDGAGADIIWNLAASDLGIDN